MRRLVPVGLLLAVPAAAAPPVAPPPRPVTPPPADARAAVARAVPFVEREGVRWMEQRRCVTCHHTSFMTWALAAAGRGVAVDAAKLTEWTAWARDAANIRGVDNPAVKDEPAAATFRRQPDAVSQLLLGAARPDAKWAAEMRSHLVAGQEANGSWKAGGQLPGQKRPGRETDEATTLWALLALAPAPDAAARTAEAKAAAWLGDKTAGVSTEWWAARLLWARGGGNAAVADACREHLVRGQRADGGWGWLLADESDALGTGIALYALLRDGAGRDAVARAVDYLRTTQRPDGSWAVKGTKAARRDRVEPTAVYWGTCWAVIALAETLPPR